MFLTEQEIIDTPQALRRTCRYFDEHRQDIRAFLSANPERKFTFFGCGSSYMLAKSAAVLFSTLTDTSACAIAAGDYIVDPKTYRQTVAGSIVVSISRSGKTSEMVRAMQHIKQALGRPIVSVCMLKDNDIAPCSALNITLDWCYDQSVCQTRTVANLYAALLLLAGEYSCDASLERSVQAVCRTGEIFQQENLPVLTGLAARNWDNAVVLADGIACGIAEEASLAFTEIAMLPGRYFHLLDYRHGPIVISGEKTLTLILLRPAQLELQRALVQDVLAHGGIVITASVHEGNPCGASAHIRLDVLENDAAQALPFLYLAQMLSLRKALSLGHNPDTPAGLDAYITL